jgi:alanine-glyoxylate transaminase/serine-glyoxylate transaminase/serine-pyruvate transaminase
MTSPVSLAHGRAYLAIPGPSVMPDRVLNAMHRAAPNIYAGALHDLVAGLWPRLRAVAGTVHHIAPYIGNGHAAWEAAISNMFSRGDKALVVAVGEFGKGWASAARKMGVDVELMDFGKSTPVDMAQVESVLRADKAHKIKALLTTHVDTSSSIKTDIVELRQLLDDTVHPALLAVDCIASLGCDAFHMDAWGVDVMVAASQKGLMTPPGMAFVWLSEKAHARCKGNDLRTPYWDWEPRIFGPTFAQHFCGTAPTHHIFGLDEALRMIEEEGLHNIWARHRVLAGAVWAAFDSWAVGNPHIGLNVANPRDRGCSVTAARIGAPDATRLRDWCETRAGVTLGIGLGMAERDDPAWHGFLRVAHMGHVNPHMTLGALAVMQAGMQTLGIAHGSGALDAATQVIAAASRA